jgi:hypothetical protein
MLTDPPPRKSNRPQFLESDHLTSLDVPENGNLVEIARAIESAMIESATMDDSAARVRKSCSDLLGEMTSFYAVRDCGVRVLAARPLRVRERWTTELFGDYSPDTRMIRVWMRTAVRKEVTSFGTFLSTLCHEFCHHLDFEKFRFPDSWHTRGFYARAGALYHCARGTPPKRLFWVASPGERWHIDWPRTNRGA